MDPALQPPDALFRARAAALLAQRRRHARRALLRALRPVRDGLALRPPPAELPAAAFRVLGDVVALRRAAADARALVFAPNSAPPSTDLLHRAPAPLPPSRLPPPPVQFAAVSHAHVDAPGAAQFIETNGFELVRDYHSPPARAAVRRDSDQSARGTQTVTVASAGYAADAPPLLARLYFHEELTRLLPAHSAGRLSRDSAPLQSLQAAIVLYNEQLYPLRARSALPMPAVPLGRFSIPPTASTRALSAGNGKPGGKVVAVPGRDSQASADGRRPPGNSLTHSEKVSQPPAPAGEFQRRTYYGAMRPEDERRAPFAMWRSDAEAICPPVQHEESRCTAEDSLPFLQHAHGYNGFRVGSFGAIGRVRLGNPSLESTCNIANFGFQKQTNYPFRRTVQSASSRRAHPLPRPQEEPVHSGACSLQLNRRVPVRDLAPPLRSLVEREQPPRGQFFESRQMPAHRAIASSSPVTSGEEAVYDIGKQGNLIQQ